MPRLFDDPIAEASELMSQLLEDTSNVLQMPSSSFPHSPQGSPFSSADRFAALVRSPVSPKFNSARSSTRSSLARQFNGVGDASKSSPAPAKDDKDGGEASPAPAVQKKSTRGRPSASSQTKPAKKAPAPSKRELRPAKRELRKRNVSEKGAVQKSGRPAKTATAKAATPKRRGRPATKAKESKATKVTQVSRKEFEVEKIVDSRIDEETMEHLFRVKWKGYSDKDNTWEPKKNLANCKNLVEAYEKKAKK